MYMCVSSIREVGIPKIRGVLYTHLHPGFAQGRSTCQFFAGAYTWVVRLVELLLQLVQLLRTEGGAIPSELRLVAVRLAVLALDVWEK